MAHPTRFLAIRSLKLAAALLLGYWAYYSYIQLTGNIHPLVEGEAYRSGQLSPSQLATLVEKRGIKSILNLRGGNYSQQWYQDEVTFARTHDLRFEDYALSTKREVTTAQAKDLIALMQEMPKPILIHCQQGADRTGLTSALYLASVKNQPAEVAAKELSLRYGHFKYTTKGRDPMDVSFANLKTELNWTE